MNTNTNSVASAWRRFCAAAASVVTLAIPFAHAQQPVSLRTHIDVYRLLQTETYATLLAFDPSEDKLYYADGEGTIHHVEVAGATSVLAYTAADHAMTSLAGMTFANDGTLYLLGNFRNGNRTTLRIRKGVPQEDGGRIWTTVAESEPYPLAGYFDHLFNCIILSPDQQYLFVQGGARGNHGEEQSNNGAFPGLRELPLSSVILRLPADGEQIVLPNNEQALRAAGYWYADGVRNTYSMAFAPNGDLFGVENSGDRDDSEELNWIREGHHYGFPWRMGTNDNPQQFPNYNPATDLLINPRFPAYELGFFRNDPSFPAPPEGVVFTDPIPSIGPDADKFRDPVDGVVKDASDLGLTIGTFTAHRSPLGLVFDTKQVLSEEFRGDGFCLSWTRGSADSDTVQGPFLDASEDLLHLRLIRQNDDYRVQVTKIVEGFNHPMAAVFDGYGSLLYVLTSGERNEIWTVRLPLNLSVADQPSGVIRAVRTLPNPVAETGRVYFELQSPATASVVLCDVFGRETVLMSERRLDSGAHVVELDTAPLASGRYYYRLNAGGEVQMGTLVVVH